jgi:very-short-patch-repair endonuclease
MAGKAAARRLRRDATDAEKALWRYLRNRSAGGGKFRRQQPIGPYIVDFVCLNARLVIEVDGGQHAVTLAADTQRTAFLEKEGYRVLRFWNHDVLANPRGVYDTIERALQSPLP